MALDPGEYDISELGPAIQGVENVDELEAILEAEKAGEDRVGAKRLVESRIEKFREDGDGGDGGFDPSEMSPADIANALQDVDSVERLQEIRELEEDAEDRDNVLRLVDKRIDSIQGSDEQTVVERDPPEERHPDLDHPTADKQYVEDLADGTYRDMWVYCETTDGELLDVSREMLGKARRLMDGYNDEYGRDERVVGVLLGDGVADLTDEVVALGADVVVYQEDAELGRFRHQPYTELFSGLARAGGELDDEPDAGDSSWRDYDEPRYVLFPATNNGRDLSALVQAELDSGLASDCSGLYIDDTVVSNPAKTGREGDKREFEAVLHMKRPDFSGFEYSTILCLDNPTREFHPQAASVIPGSFEAPEPDPSREGETYEYDFDLPEEWFGVEVTEHDELDSGVDLTGHDVVVALGRGIGDDPTEGMELGLELTDAFADAALGITRGIVTSSYDFDGHVEQYAAEERQIGETGQVVEPKLYVAAGISGAVQHKVGMDESDTIVAVNTDPDADIRDFSDYYVRGDLFEVLPALTEALESGELDEAALTAGGVGDD
ncbi:electron transfer flavoprotein subunit alpha/FixB family protein [Halobacterium jilantaiense]|uniref:Electron transfer flavoprotein alpha subunit apoprotein n=1 Tax=Halobacterium jilantaiense TaxID=355548 RepID=A0A1I0P3J8_9EURY|nr:electron transfer flavoprotein subunit alpha/FixB family protein [Halobacterium jilantaiense]SEW08791.1 electron transfer flavoprotein alpha subunit apoprotein [Halobacterium jilantaiense]